MSRLIRLLVGALAITTAVAATAGQTCDAAPPDIARMTRALGLAERVQRSLDASGAQVVIIARAGQDLRKYGLNWSHLAFAYREETPAQSVPGHRFAPLGPTGAAIVEGLQAGASARHLAHRPQAQPVRHGRGRRLPPGPG